MFSSYIYFLGPDINECTTRIHNCSDTSTCENTLGSFHCQCPSGSDLNTTTMSCIDTPKEEPKYLGWTTVLLGKLPYSFSMNMFCRTTRV